MEKRRKPHAPAIVSLRISEGLLGGDAVHLSLRLRLGDARFQTSEQDELPLHAFFPELGISGRRRPEFSLFRQVIDVWHLSRSRKIEAFRQDSDHRAWHLINGDGLADNLCISAEAPLPQVITDEHYEVFARLFFFS